MKQVLKLTLEDARVMMDGAIKKAEEIGVDMDIAIVDDGGHLMFYLFEKILGKPLSQKTQEGFFRIGLFLLFSLMFFVTFNDLKDLGLF